MRPSLPRLQSLILRLIAAPEGVAAGLRALSADERALWNELDAARGGMSMQDRLDIYANMYFYRLRDALADDFPAVVVVTGAEQFHNLITDYLLAHPPSHYSLRYAGRHLASFLQKHALQRQWPYLGDLAQLEWAILTAFDAADAPVLEASALAQLPPQAWSEIKFVVVPSLQLLALQWPVHETWHAVQRGELPQPLSEVPTAMRVWRQDLRVFHKPISAVEMQALGQLQQGASFAAICETAGERIGDTAAETIAEYLALWVNDGVLSAALVGDSISRSDPA